LIILTIVAVIIAVVLYVLSALPKANQSENEIENKTETEQKTISQNYNGQYIQGITINGWEINEITTDNHPVWGKGLQGIEIIRTVNGIENKLFELDFQGGVGGTPTCSKIFKFQDTSAEYIKLKSDFNNTFFSEPIPFKIIDLSNEKHLSFNLFGIDSRIVYSNADVNDIYMDTSIDNAQAFDPGCDELQNVVEFPKLNFNSSSEGTSFSVKYYSDLISKSDVPYLVEILKSLVAK
jgi:hypothetical protein